MQRNSPLIGTIAAWSRICNGADIDLGAIGDRSVEINIAVDIFDDRRLQSGRCRVGFSRPNRTGIAAAVEPSRGYALSHNGLSWLRTPRDRPWRLSAGQTQAAARIERGRQSIPVYRCPTHPGEFVESPRAELITRGAHHCREPLRQSLPPGTLLTARSASGREGAKEEVSVRFIRFSGG